MDSNKIITARELGEMLGSLEQEIDGFAKLGIRTYAPNDTIAYKLSLALIDLLESKGIDLRSARAYWVLHAPTQHRTIKESKPFDTRGDELEVFEKVLTKILRGEGDIDDFNFIKEIEKRSGLDVLDEDLRAKTIPTMMQLKKLIAEQKKILET